MRGILCDACGTFVPDRHTPRGVYRYVGPDESGRPREQEAHHCDQCADKTAARFGLIVQDAEPIHFDAGEGDE